MSGPAREQRGGPGARGGAPLPNEHTSVLEWIVAALGLVLVLASVGVMIADARQDRTPPDVVVRPDTVHAFAGGGFLVRFTARNRGRETAAEVSIVGELRDSAGVERSGVIVDYLPGDSERRGGLFFVRDPRAGALRIRAEGYREP